MTQLLPGFLILSAGLMAGCAMSSAPVASERIDHVVLAISDLDRGTAQLGAICGVMPMPGGKHPHTGTQNALLSAGSHAYLEVLAPQEGVQLPPEYQPLRALAELMPVDWAVATRDADLTVRTLRAAGYAVSEPEEGSRQTPEGSLLRWRTFRVTTPDLQTAPFFIEWHAATPHPSTTSPQGCSLQSLELRTPNDANVRRLLDVLKLPVVVTRAQAPMLVVTLQGRSGITRLPSASSSSSTRPAR